MLSILSVETGLPRMTKPRGTVRKTDHQDAGTLLPDRLMGLAETLAALIEEPQLKRHALPMKDWKVMQALAAHGALQPAEIHRRNGQDKAQISRALKCLLDRGLVSKDPHPEDARTFVVSLTEAGHALYRDIAADMRRRQDTILGGISSADAERFRRLVDRLEKSLDGPAPGRAGSAGGRP